MADDLFILVGAALLGGTVQQPRHELIVISNQQEHTVNLLMSFGEDRIEFVHLRGVAGVPVQQEAVGGVCLSEARPHHPVRHRIGN